MYCLVKRCSFRAVMRNEGRIYSRFQHNHELVAQANPPEESAEEQEANGDIKVEVDEEEEQRDEEDQGNIGELEK